MSDISKVVVNGVAYDIKDIAARNAAETAEQNAKDYAIPVSLKGAANGVAELDENGLIPASQLPSFVDDVLEYTNKASFPSTGEAGKIYVDKSNNLTYRWGGTDYVEISASLALGETSSTAYAGDKGKAVADAVATKAEAQSITAGTIGTSEGTVSAVSVAVPYVNVTSQGVVSGYGTHTHTIYTEATGSLAANGTSLVISNSAITANSTIEVFSSVYGVNPTAMTTEAGKCTLTFTNSHVAASIKIRIS